MLSITPRADSVAIAGGRALQHLTESFRIGLRLARGRGVDGLRIAVSNRHACEWLGDHEAIPAPQPPGARCLCRERDDRHPCPMRGDRRAGCERLGWPPWPIGGHGHLAAALQLTHDAEERSPDAPRSRYADGAATEP